MAVCPCCLLSRRSARRIEKALLCQQNKWSLGMPAIPCIVFTGCYLMVAISNMDGSGIATRLGNKWNWAVESPVNFKGAHPIPVSIQLGAINGRKAMSANMEQLPRRHIKQQRP